MGVPKLKTKISVEEYLEGELISPIRHEYIGGEVYAMAGASDRHHRICSNLFTSLDEYLEDSDCDVLHLDMKLRVSSDNIFYYPDVFVACDQNPVSEFYREEPVLVIEIASPSTRQIDRREKLKVYQSIPSVKEYVTVEQDKTHVELHRRQANGTWITYFYNENDLDEVIEFQSVGLKTGLDEIYRRVKFPVAERSLQPEI